MEPNVGRLLHRVSLFICFISTLSLLHLFSHLSFSCSISTPISIPHSLSSHSLPRSSCDAAAAISRRPHLPPHRRFQRLRSSRAFTGRVAALSLIFSDLRRRHLLSNSSHVLCLSAGAGHDVFALRQSGVADVTGIDILDFPPLVRRADPHNLPFFDEVFDLGFTAGGIEGALFPARFAAEMERTVRRGGAAVLAVERCRSRGEAEKIAALFKRSSLVGVADVKIVGNEMSLIIMRRENRKKSKSLQ